MLGAGIAVRIKVIVREKFLSIMCIFGVLEGIITVYPLL
jgi:hypothetical protein